MKEYTFSYRFDNKSWAISIWADSKEEALRKFWALKENGEYSGEIVSRIDVTKTSNAAKSLFLKVKEFLLKLKKALAK
jgi:hypothetical protein|nr:MAG TPA: hypothetical protein [Caudoviricetes sp.]